MSASDPSADEKHGQPSGSNPFVRYGWLSVYYREAATTAGFHAQDDTTRWQRLRDRVLLGPPKDDGLRQRAIDAIPRHMQSLILDWLQSREIRGK